MPQILPNGRYAGRSTYERNRTREIRKTKSVKTPVSRYYVRSKSVSVCSRKSALPDYKITTRHRVCRQQCCSFLLQANETALGCREANIPLSQRYNSTGTTYSKKAETEALTGYTDADWGGDCNDYKSTTGYLFQIGGTAVTWKSKKQSCVALSTAEAEYMALSSAAQEAVWMRELISDLRNPPATSTEILEDNQSAISMAKNPQFHGRTKHINIKYHFIREQIANGTICLKYCPTEDAGRSTYERNRTREIRKTKNVVWYVQTSQSFS